MRPTLLYSLPPHYIPLQHETHLVVFLAPSLHPITTRDPPCCIPCPLVTSHYNMRHETHLVVFLAPSLHPITTRDPPCCIPCPLVTPITTRDPPCCIPCPLVTSHYNMRPTLLYSLPPSYIPLQHETHLVVFLAP